MHSLVVLVKEEKEEVKLLEGQVTVEEVQW